MKITVGQLKQIIKETVEAAMSEVADPTEELINRLKYADWDYEYSDDPSVYRSGKEKIGKLEKDVLELGRTDDGKKMLQTVLDMGAKMPKLSTNLVQRALKQS